MQDPFQQQQGNESREATPHGKRDQSKLTKMNTKLAARKKN